MTTITLDDALQARIRAACAPEEDFQDFIAAAAQELLARRERQAQARAAAQAEAQAILNGPSKPFDPGATYRRYKEKYGWSDMPDGPPEQMEAEAEAILAALPPEKIAEAVRQGLL